jgi:protein-S-isoprenylcysteine O-methyltransferase Ste14
LKKSLFNILAVFILNILPLLSAPYLLLNFKVIFLVIGSLLIWYTQPAFSWEETSLNKHTDNYSVIIILFAASISIVLQNVEWAYWRAEKKSNLFITILGACIIIIGITIRIWSIKILGTHFTATVRTQENHILIDGGPYSFVRHPSYLGAFLAIVGGSVFLNAYLSIIVSTILMFVAYYVRISHEEKILTAFFGDKYIQYSKKTKKLFPFIW